MRRFLKLPSWRKTERIVVGGGFSDGRAGQLAIARSVLLLRAKGLGIDVLPIRHDPDEAGLIGALHLVPADALDGFDAMLAADIGGTNIRAGAVDLVRGKNGALDGKLRKVALWRHRDDSPTRDEAAARLVAMLSEALATAKRRKRRVAPIIGIGCPGLVRANGSIAGGGQNLPGNWASRRFNLPALVRAAIPEIQGRTTLVLMHNDAVVQGLSELPRMRDVKRWGALTIGTGLGNARFTNRRKKD